MVRVTFLHPDLGIGGAERLVVDAALAMMTKGHEVRIVTTHHDPNHSFTETRDGTLPITVFGDWLPRHIFGKFFALCAYLRMVYAAICLYVSGPKPDVVFCDQVSVCIPILHLFVRHVIFYCHYPDQLLTERGGRWKSYYRAPINFLEEMTTGLADKIFVNSAYTRTVFSKTFESVTVMPEILYPSINTKFFDDTRTLPLSEALGRKLPENAILLLSINRYERKKNLSLAIEALAELRELLSDDVYERTYLAMIGGYDERVVENVQHFEELARLADELSVDAKTIFLKSPSDVVKASLLANCAIVVYTPTNEHFGIVPLEAMYFKKPVVAQDSGGPTESVLNGETGFLTKPSPRAVAERVAILIQDKRLLDSFGESGYKHFHRVFGPMAFANRLDAAICDLIKGRK